MICSDPTFLSISYLPPPPRTTRSSEMEIPSHNEETMEQQPDLTVLPPPIEHIAQAHDKGFAAEADPAVTYNASEPTSADPGEFELYYNDPANIPDASKMPYIMVSADY